VVVRSMKSCDLRTASDLIQNYLPARYLCELHESQWTPDFRTLITSQLPTDAWHTYLGGSLVAEGILDRLMHSTHRAELRALESMRKGEQKNSENATLTPSASSTN
ncbi:ATP-binding protein, partial [Bdellovibrionota bacterium FG-1]